MEALALVVDPTPFLPAGYPPPASTGLSDLGL